MEAASKASKTAPSPALLAAIDKSFGSLDEMKAKWSAAAAPGAVFGSGWVWLVLTAKDELQIVGTPNQDNVGAFRKRAAKQLVSRGRKGLTLSPPPARSR
jgi:superoxide dismutase